MDRAKFKYSAVEGVLELEGTEDFVSKHFDSLADMVRVMARHAPSEPKQEAGTLAGAAGEAIGGVDESANVSGGSAEISEAITQYPTVFSEINGKLKIVADMPGSSKKQQMMSAALLYCYGSELLGDDQVTSKAIREVCEEHGCIDEANFSKIFADKTLFMIDGVKGGTKQVKLTYNGKKRARELLANV